MNKNRFFDWAKKYRFVLICTGIALIHLLFSIRVSARQSLGMDEMAQLGFIVKKNSWGRMFRYYLTTEITNLPFYPIFAAIWYRIVPYGEKWLLLFNEICVFIGIILLAIAAKIQKSEWAGYLTALLATISSTLVLRCDMEFRTYAFLFLFCAATLLCYFKRYQELGQESYKSVVILGAVMTCLAYSHYFGCLFIVALFLCDAFLFLQKKIRFRVIISYIMSGGLLTPWFVAMLLMKQKTIAEFWPKSPNFASLPEAVRFALNNDEILFICFLIAAIYVICKTIEELYTKKLDVMKTYGMFVCVVIIAFIVMTAYVYSAYINPIGGIFVLKYFVSIIPPLLLLIAGFLSDMTERLCSSVRLSKVSVYVTLLLFLFFYVGMGNFYYDVKDSLSTYLDPYREVRDFVMEQGDIHESDVAMLVSDTRHTRDGYEEYYFQYAGKEVPIEMISMSDSDAAQKMQQYRKLYVFEARNKMHDELEDILKEKYKKTGGVSEYQLRVYEKK